MSPLFAVIMLTEIREAILLILFRAVLNLHIIGSLPFSTKKNLCHDTDFHTMFCRFEPERYPHIEYFFDPRYPDGPIYGRGRHPQEFEQRRPDFDRHPWGPDRPPPYYDMPPWEPGRRSPGFDRHPYDRSPPDRHFWEADRHRRDLDERSPDRDPSAVDGEPAYNPYLEDVRSLSGLDVSKEDDRKRFMEIAKNRGLLEPEHKDHFPGEDMRGYQTPQQGQFNMNGFDC